MFNGLKNLIWPVMLLAILFFLQTAKAATPPTIQINFSFDSSTYVPAEYALHARSLPAPGSTVTITASLYTESNGVLIRIDPNKYRLQWLGLGRNLGDEKGLNTISFMVPRNATPGSSITVTLYLYQIGQDTFFQSQALQIPIANSEILFYKINNGKVSAQAQTEFSVSRSVGANIFAQPYFFNAPNVGSLYFTWQYKDQSITPTANADPRILQVNIPQNYPVPGQEQFSLTIKTLAQPIIGVIDGITKTITLDINS